MNDATTKRKVRTKRTLLERLEVTGPMEQSKEVMQRLHDDGYRLTRSGPKCRPEVDMQTFHFIAEREVSP